MKFVKANFLAGREFVDDADLARECQIWLQRVNEERVSDATQHLPMALLAAERPHFKPLPATAQDYGLFDSVLVSRESPVTVATNRYSVPVAYLGQALTARIHPKRIAFYQGTTLVASHPRCHGRHTRIVTPEHYEPVFAHKPRARTMVYRDWLIAQAPGVATYVQRLCLRRYQEMDHQILGLYTLAREVGTERFVALVEAALEQEAVGIEYLRAVPRAAAAPAGGTPRVVLQLLGPTQREVERDLACYEAYVANGAVALVAEGAGR